jgi:hypothetical protein
VLALCVAKDISGLLPLKSLEIDKLFHLYGARAAVTLGKKSEFLTDWAVSQGILSRSIKNAAFTEKNGSYRLQNNIDELFPVKDCPWDDGVKDGLEDLATLVAAIYEKYKGTALVALTSVASKQELQCALEAELHLWLYDHTASVYKGLAELSQLAGKMTDPIIKELEDANRLLSKTANFTTQVQEKIKLEEDLWDIYSEINKLAAIDSLTRRCWRDLRITLDERIRIESVPHGLQEITSALRIAHVTNRILRELLTLAGFKDERSTGLKNSLDLL